MGRHRRDDGVTSVGPRRQHGACSPALEWLTYDRLQRGESCADRRSVPCSAVDLGAAPEKQGAQFLSAMSLDQEIRNLPQSASHPPVAAHTCYPGLAGWRPGARPERSGHDLRSTRRGRASRTSQWTSMGLGDWRVAHITAACSAAPAHSASSRDGCEPAWGGSAPVGALMN